MPDNSSDPVLDAFRRGMIEMQGRCRVLAETIAAEARLARRMTGAGLHEQEQTAERLKSLIERQQF